MYSDDDIERLILLRRARDAGESLAQMAKLNNDELRAMVRSSAKSYSSSDSDIFETGRNGDCLRESMEAIRNLDQSGLESCLLEARVTMQPQRYLEQIIVPLLEEMGEAWSRGEARVAHEHLASSVVRSVLGTIMVTNQADENAPLLVSTTLPGQLHELGALMAAVTAVAIGWRVAYLGPNLPAEDIAAVAKQGNAKAIALSVVYPPDDPRFEIELKKLRRSVGEKIAIVIGGRAAANYRAAIDSVGGKVVDDLRDLIAKLFSIRAGSSSHEAGERTTR
jgi:methanogenic corrinoid protein MtbC1